MVFIDFHAEATSARLITNRAGYSVAYHVYYPFGEEATAFSQDAERMKFTGHERDLANPAGPGDDLDYMHARHCSPLTGRFLSVDPVLQVDRAQKMPQLWNRYAYVLGNPLAYLDPTGAVVNLGAMSDSERAVLIDQLSTMTGLPLGYDSKSQTLQILGPAVIGSGSPTARKDLTTAIEAKEVYYGISRNNFETVNMAQRVGPHLNLDFADIAKIDTGKNPAATFNAGVLFLHELKHAQGLRDPSKAMLDRVPHLRGETVDHMNRTRKELGLPLRSQYRTERDSKGRYYIPFSKGPVYVPGEVK